jgi:O-antigen ligase
MKVKDGTAPMINAWFIRARRALVAYHPGTLVLAALPITVAFGTLAVVPLGELHATPTDALVGVLAVWPFISGSGPPRAWPRIRRAPGAWPRIRRAPGAWPRIRRAPGAWPRIRRAPGAWPRIRRAPGVEPPGSEKEPLRAGDGWPYRLLVGVLATLVVLMAVSLVWAVDRALAAKDALKWGEALVVVLVAPRWLQRSRDVWLVMGVMLAVALVEALLGIAQGTLLASALPVSADRGVRVVGTFGQPNPYAGYLNLTLPLLLAYVAWGSARTWRLIGAGMALVLGAALALAQSRGATLALSAALLAMAWVGWPPLRRWLVGAAAALGAIVLVALLTGHLTLEAVLTRLGWRPLTDAALSQHVTDANFSTVERLAHWAAALRMLAAHPWLGVGAGNYPIAYPRYAVPRWPLALGHAHSLYLNLAAELGIGGGLLTVAFAGATIWLAVGGRAETMCAPSGEATKSACANWSAWGLLGVMVAVAVHNVFDDLTTHAMLVQQMLVVACGQTWCFARLNEIE